MSIDQPSVLSRLRTWGRTDLPMILIIVVWGLNFSIIKVSLREFSPLSFNALRFGISTLVLLMLLRWRGESFSLSRRDLIPVILLGLGGHTVYQLAFINGIAITTAANSSLLMATSPIFVVIYSRLLRVEKPSWRVWMGVLLSFLGIAVLITGGNGELRLGSNIVGDLLVLAAATLWAVYTTGSKPLLRRYSPIKLTAMSMVAGTAPLLLLSLPQLFAQDWQSVSLLAWAGLSYSAIFAIVIAYTVWYASIQRVGTSRTAVYSNLLPVVGVLIAWVMLGDRLSLLQALGGAVALLGLVLARWARREAIRAQ